MDRRYAATKSSDKPPRDMQAIYSYIFIYFSAQPFFFEAYFARVFLLDI